MFAVFTHYNSIYMYIFVRIHKTNELIHNVVLVLDKCSFGASTLLAGSVDLR